MKVRVRLLVGSLAVAAIASVTIGWAIARVGSSDTSDGSMGTDSTIDRSAVTNGVADIETNEVVTGSGLPDITLPDIEGNQIAMASLVGTPLIINVWGSTCGPCKEELPAFAAADQKYGDRVRFVGVDFLGPTDREEAFARDRGVRYELLYDENGEFISELGIASFPVTLFINADGVIVRQSGRLTEQELTDHIENDLL